MLKTVTMTVSHITHSKRDEKCDCTAVALRTWLKSYFCFIDLLCEVPDCVSVHTTILQYIPWDNTFKL